MNDVGGFEGYTPGEGVAGAPEELSEEAKQRFAAAAAGMQQIRREEKKSKKRDDQVARAIVQFLGDEDHAHLFILISRLVARDCPSIFILAIVSLIHKESREEVERYLEESVQEEFKAKVDSNMALTKGGGLDAETSRILILWIVRMQTVLSLSPQQILLKLMIDERNIDGTVLQLTTFVIQEFFESQGHKTPFEKLQPLTASILQTVFEPFISSVRKLLLEQARGTDE